MEAEKEKNETNKFSQNFYDKNNRFSSMLS